MFSRRRLRVDYYARGSNEITSRVVSPQRLVCCRENWYLDAWCHLHDGLRSFSLDGVRKTDVLEATAKNVAEDEMEEFLAAGYGILSPPRRSTVS